jgi:hypothetical protein
LLGEKVYDFRIIFTFFYFTGVWTQGLVLARQVLYDLSHTPSPRIISKNGKQNCRIKKKKKKLARITVSLPAKVQGLPN